jgi:hypothetical protein
LKSFTGSLHLDHLYWRIVLAYQSVGIALWSFGC